MHASSMKIQNPQRIHNKLIKPPIYKQNNDYHIICFQNCD